MKFRDGWVCVVEISLSLLFLLYVFFKEMGSVRVCVSKRK